jgi:hypothetical protein
MIKRVARWMGWISLGVGLAACGKDPPPPAPATAQTAAPTATAAATAPSPPASASAVATATAAASAAATATAQAFVASPEPELGEWGRAREIPVKGSSKLHCETKMVREWLRVMCVDRDNNTPTEITITKGRRPGERSRGENLRAVNNITTLVQAVPPGTDFEATFHWLTQEHVLTVKWPEGAPESARVISFDDSAPAADGADEWASAKEVTVSGSSALGCETKVVKETLRVLCGQKAALDQINVTKESPKNVGRLDKTKRGTALLVSLAEGAHLEATFAFTDGTSRRLLLDWPKGQPMPSPLAKFVTP